MIKPTKRHSRLKSFVENPSKSLWTLAIPIIAGMGIQTLYSIVDMIFIGKLSGDAIAAVAFNFPIFFFVMGISFGLGGGVTASIARFIGSDDKVNADNAAEHAVMLAFAISVILTSLGLLYGRQILLKIGCTPDVLPQAWEYLKVSCYGLPFGVFSGFFRSILAGEGDMKFPMILAGIGTVLNIILDPIFIFTLNFGVAGAAWATTISQMIICIIFIYMLFFKDHAYVQFKLRDFNPSYFILVDIIKVGLPASISMIIMALGQLIFNRMLASFSTSAVAAYQVGGRIDMVVFLPIFGISSALTTIVGMFFGANEIDKIKYITKYGISRAFIITSFGSILLYTFAPGIISGFTNELVIKNIAVNYLRVISILFPFIAIGMTIGRILQGIGLGMPSLIITTIRIIGLAGPLAYYFIYILDKPLVWIWYAMFISGILATIISIIWLKLAFRKFLIAKPI
jgi:putative MATE family efflux protein